MSDPQDITMWLGEDTVSIPDGVLYKPEDGSFRVVFRAETPKGWQVGTIAIDAVVARGIASMVNASSSTT